MTYNNFEQEIDAVILNRGLTYFEAEAVQDLEQTAEGWDAIVHGTEVYEVFIEGRRKVKDWDCDCPYDRGPICKHVVAVLYTIQAIQSKKKKSKSNTKIIDQIFSTVPEKDLLAFFRKHIKRNKDLKNKLILQFSDQLEGDKLAHYEMLIDSIFAGGKSRGNFIPYHDFNRITKQLFVLINKSTVLIAAKNYLEAFQINKALLLKIIDVSDHVDDSAGGLVDMYYSILNNLENLLKQVKAYELKEEILKFLLSSFKRCEIQQIESEVLDIILEHHDQMLDLKEIETGLISKISATAQQRFGEYQLPYLILPLLKLYKETNQHEAYQTLQQKHLFLPTVRGELVEHYISQKQWSEARQLVDEGIKIAQKNAHSETIREWKLVLIEIAIKEKDKPLFRSLLEEVYLEANFHDEDIYTQLKKAWGKSEWPGYRDKLIQKISKNKNIGWNEPLQWVAEIYSQDNDYDALMTTLQKDKTGYVILKYYHELTQTHPTEILELLVPIAIKKAEAMGRPSYKQLAQFIKELKSIKGGNENVQKLLKQFRHQYANRPAMIEELSGL